MMLKKSLNCAILGHFSTKVHKVHNLNEKHIIKMFYYFW